MMSSYGSPFYVAMIVVFIFVPIKGHGQETHIAVILPQNTSRLFSLSKVLPAIDLALHHVTSSGIVPNGGVKVEYADSQCSEADAINEAINFYIAQKADVFLGPVCDYAAAPLVRQARFWDVPVITSGAMAGDFRGRDGEPVKEYRTLTRINANFNSLTSYLITMFRYYQWNNAKLIYQYDGYANIIDSYCHLFTASLHENMQAHRFKHDYFKMLNSRDLAILDKLGTEIGLNFSDYSSHNKYPTWHVT